MIPRTLHFYGHGKLLLAGEYFVLDGGLALALPCRLGQQMVVRPDDKPGKLSWQSLDEQGKPWFTGSFDCADLSLERASDPELGQRLQMMLKAARSLQPTFLREGQSLAVETRLEFPRNWGLGTSSTLISMLAQWARVDPFLLSQKSLGGSGYDIAAATAAGPFLYRTGLPPTIQPTPFEPAFADQIYFIYLGKKQNSRTGIQHYRERIKDQPELVAQISRLVEQLLHAGNLTEFSALLTEHERFIHRELQLPLVQDQYFSDFWGVVKSLGAWGGDFVLVVSDRSAAETKAYFNEKGYDVFFNYRKLILGPGEE